MIIILKGMGFASVQLLLLLLFLMMILLSLSFAFSIYSRYACCIRNGNICMYTFIHYTDEWINVEWDGFECGNGIDDDEIYGVWLIWYEEIMIMTLLFLLFYLCIYELCCSLFLVFPVILFFFFDSSLVQENEKVNKAWIFTFSFI